MSEIQVQRRGYPLTVGEPAPPFSCRTRAAGRFVFDTVAGRYVILAFLGDGSSVASQALLRDVWSARHRFDDLHVAFFGVSTNPSDMERPLLQDAFPGIRFFWDFDRSVSELYGAIGADGGYRNVIYVLDVGLRVLTVLTDLERGEALLSALDMLPPVPAPALAQTHAPVLIVPRIFEPGLCHALISYYEERGGMDSGFMREVNGRTTGAVDYQHKRRRDRNIDDEKLRHSCMVRIYHRLAPLIQKAFRFRATRIERYVVACYDAQEGGYFRPHRDDTTKGTAHRRFAVSLFLNSGEYEGGYLRFPEFGNLLYGAPTGGAVVFSCSLLHEATNVTRGKRYMFLPFLYDEPAAALRDANKAYVDSDNIT